MKILQNYKGNTPEFAQYNYLVSINGSGGGGGGTTETIGTKDAPINVAKALELINALADGGTTDEEAYVSGKIKQIKTTDENIVKFKNIDYVITDGTNWTFIESTAKIPAGANVHIAFRYTSTSSTAATWEIESLSVK